MLFLSISVSKQNKKDFLGGYKIVRLGQLDKFWSLSVRAHVAEMLSGVEDLRPVNISSVWQV